MNVICALFGHRLPEPGWWGDVPYVKVRNGYGGVDSIGRVHGELYHECGRCGKEYLAGRIHLNDAVVRDAIARHPDLFSAEPSP